MKLNEREAFEKAQHGKIWDWVYFCEEKNAYRLKIVTTNDDKFRAVNELNYGWLMWQKAKAQAVPEGFRLISNEKVEKCIEFLAVASSHPNNSADDENKIFALMEELDQSSESGDEG